MDKDSLPHSQPSTRSGRRSTPNDARSVSRPSTQATPGPSTAAAQSHTGQVPGWHPQQPPVPLNGPESIDEVARALRTIQDAYPFLVQSVAYHQQGLPNQFPSAVPPQLSSQPPWPLVQPSTSHGATASQYTPGFGQLVPPATTYGAPYPTPQLSAPLSAAPGQSSFQADIPAEDQEGTPIDAEATAEEKRKRNTAASARFRVKKRIQTQNLERNVTDLSGRVDELEQEAAELRRENGWLKEIVMLKTGKARGGGLLAGPSQPFSSPDPREEDDEDEDREAKGSIRNKGK